MTGTPESALSSAGRFMFRTPAPLGLEGPEAATLWEHGCRGVVETGCDVVGYFDTLVDLPLAGSWEELPEDDYLERYYRELDSVTVGPLVIAPTHRTASLSAGQKPLWIDPGMAFGTGHHETTRLALEALAESEPFGKRVLDVGSGSGILAIAADLLGAVEARGIDIDPDTIPVATRNAALNRSRATFALGGLTAAESADLVVANLHAELHVELAEAYARSVAPGGELLVTGILADREGLVGTALARAFTVRDGRSAGEWRLLRAVRRADDE
jgi:ribosomal protein L11 methyltransferase